MREIKFRGKRKISGEWMYGYYYSECGNHYIIDNRQSESETNRNHPYKVIPETIGQYTGHKDKNGKEIYEGDILEYRRCGQKTKHKVEYDESTTTYWCGDGTLVDVIFENGDWMMKNFKVEGLCVVIGSIHDNPELITK